MAQNSSHLEKQPLKIRQKLRINYVNKFSRETEIYFNHIFALVVNWNKVIAIIWCTISVVFQVSLFRVPKGKRT